MSWNYVNGQGDIGVEGFSCPVSQVCCGFGGVGYQVELRYWIIWLIYHLSVFLYFGIELFDDEFLGRDLRIELWVLIRCTLRPTPW